jgi:hypothetical protein
MPEKRHFVPFDENLTRLDLAGDLDPLLLLPWTRIRSSPTSSSASSSDPFTTGRAGEAY